jgi:putative tryptophan/tyrosine transport system substrate-binding protein
VRLNVDIIFAMSQPAIQAAQRATTTIPIVMMDVSDPVEAGFIRSLAHPGGNITGVTAIALELSGKQLALLKEAAPGVTRIAVLGTQAILALHGPEVQRVAQGLDVQLQVLVVEGLDDIANAFEHATRRRAGAVLVLPQLLFAVNDRRIAELAAQSQLPTIFWRREFAEVGGLLAYGASQQDLYRRAATYVDKILKGAKSGDLPVEQPTKFTLVINLKTAQALGLTIPPMLLFQADEVLR